MITRFSLHGEGPVAAEMYIAGELSGIQKYLLEVSSAGGGQARRLRARSFYVQAVSEAAAWRVLRACNAGREAIKMSGGGQFLIRAPLADGAPARLAQLREELCHSLYLETGGQLSLALEWDRLLDSALRARQRAKRRPFGAVTVAASGWNCQAMCLPETGEPCHICRHRRAECTVRDGENDIRVCARCRGETELGKAIPRLLAVFLVDGPGDFQAAGSGIQWRKRPSAGAPAAQLPLHRHIPADADGQPLTFEQIALRSRGDKQIAVLKADVDDMGARVAHLARTDSSLADLSAFSRELDDFFAVQLQQCLKPRTAWDPIYTVYSGGDDLLIVGPWDTVLDFAGYVREAFAAGPGCKHGLTLSAGVVQAPWRLPIRHAVEAADHLLETAKTGPKNQCAALGEVWDWSRHQPILAQGKSLAAWIASGALPRNLAHQFLFLLSSQKPNRSALWAYQTGRNLRPGEVRSWAEAVLQSLDSPRATSVPEVRAALRYALAATRKQKEGD